MATLITSYCKTRRDHYYTTRNIPRASPCSWTSAEASLLSIAIIQLVQSLTHFTGCNLYIMGLPK